MATDGLSPVEHVDRIKRRAAALAEALREANDAGVSPALILPQLMLIFRGQFGELPPGVQIPGVPA